MIEPLLLHSFWIYCFFYYYLDLNEKGYWLNWKILSFTVFQVDLTLDRLKHKGATKRVLFLHNKMSHYSKNMTVSNNQGPACEELKAYLIVSESIHIYAVDMFLSEASCSAGEVYCMFYRKSNPWTSCSTSWDTGTQRFPMTLLLVLGCEKLV